MIPRDMALGAFVNVYKKDDPNQLDKYRNIALLPHAIKVFTKIITGRLLREIDPYLPDTHA